MGTTHKVVLVAFRIFEFVAAAIIVGFLAKYFNLIHSVNGTADSRVIYAISMASISVVASLIFVLPLRYSFSVFPLDLALFICWIVCFALLIDLTGTRTCNSYWFDTYWTAYWNPDTGNTVVVTGSACAKWRAVLAFSFISSILWLLTGFLGLYVCIEYYNLGSTLVSFVRRFVRRKKSKDADLEHGRGQDPRLPMVG